MASGVVKIPPAAQNSVPRFDDINNLFGKMSKALASSGCQVVARRGGLCGSKECVRRCCDGMRAGGQFSEGLSNRRAKDRRVIPPSYCSSSSSEVGGEEGQDCRLGVRQMQPPLSVRGCAA